MAGFEFAQPETLAEAASLVHAHGPDALVLAGGQSVLILLRQRLLNPRVVVSLARIAPLRSESLDDGRLVLGAMTTYAAMQRSPGVGRLVPVLASAAGSVGSAHIRTLGTIGGSLCHADPAGDVPVALTAVDASLRVRRADGQSEERPIDGFFTGLFETTLDDDDILQEVVVPPQPSTATYGYRRFSFRAGEYPMCVVVTRLEWSEAGRCVGARVAVGGAGPSVTRLAPTERELEGEPLEPGRVEAAIEASDSALEPMADVRGGADWKKKVVRHMLREAISSALAGARTP